MAKMNKWDKLVEDVSQFRIAVMICNPTAEQCGAFYAYDKVLRRMKEIEALEKRLDKP